jgi:Tfp pilus assembly protein PilN
VITNNLSTRPFYNEGAVRAWLLVAAILLGIATIINVSRVLYYSRSDTELALQASRDEARAAELTETAARLRSSVDATQIATASVEAREANDLIDRRTFSWTELFNRFEATLPPEVRITSVRPSVNAPNRPITLAITVVASGVAAVNEFMENLESTGKFIDIGSALSERVNDAGQLETAFEMGYIVTAPQGPRQ